MEQCKVNPIFQCQESVADLKNKKPVFEYL